MAKKVKPDLAANALQQGRQSLINLTQTQPQAEIEPTTQPIEATTTERKRPQRIKTETKEDRRVRADGDVVRAISVSLRQSEYAKFDAIADTIKTTRMALMNAALRHFLAEHETGNLSLTTSIDNGRVMPKIVN